MSESPPPPPCWATLSGLAQNFGARAAVARHVAPPPPPSKHPGAAAAQGLCGADIPFIDSHTAITYTVDGTLAINCSVYCSNQIPQISKCTLPYINSSKVWKSHLGESAVSSMEHQSPMECYACNWFLLSSRMYTASQRHIKIQSIK